MIEQPEAGIPRLATRKCSLRLVSSFATAICLVCFAVAAAYGQPKSVSPPAESGQAPTPVKVNRTLPNVKPPGAELEFSPTPTTQEIFRARVFEEPLVPIGGDPNAVENGALAAALVGYSKRTSPDDFASLTGFLAQYSKSPWRAALLLGLGLEHKTKAATYIELVSYACQIPLSMPCKQ